MRRLLLRSSSDEPYLDRRSPVASAKWSEPKLDFETSEGTWMNLDVSPDGKRIVFDLLGDIYTMPIDGGRSAATRLTSGPVFDMQPKFSPDGKRIAFSSDRDGLWNIWTMTSDGKDAKQVSRERRWFVNSPAWSPDGSFIYARKHFVKERSLGAGEIWMYHAAGAGDGLQVTERTGWQKDNGEPEISPDGRYLYYSKDVTPGITFEYNKDPNGLIYAIMRRDLVTGRERRAVSVQGGSVAPQVSPDGKTLAYVRRVRLRSFLYLRELETGRDRQLFGNVDKDLQEAWAIHGLYPQYSWTPDGRSIVIWGEGRIWRVDVASGKGQEIPFVARVEQTLNAPVRFPIKVHPDQFPVRMLRDVRTSPDGKAVVYSALGHLYIRKLPDGKPERLTKEAKHEFFPSYSRDGQWIVYTTWSDVEHGRVRVVRADGTAGRDVVTRPGHYVEPSFSPDGRQIVFRHAGADLTRSPLFGDDPGVYVVPATGGDPKLVRDGGASPEFDHTGTRVYLREVRNEKFTLFSVGLPAGDTPLPGRDEIDTSEATTPPSTLSLRTATGSLSKSGSGHSWRRFRKRAGRSTSVPARRPIRCNASRATRASICIGPATAAVCSGLSVPSLFSRDLARTSPSSRGGSRSLTNLRPRASRSDLPSMAINRPDRLRSSARASSPWEG